jgi:RND family efflux transporter MFP subunit
MATQVPNSSLLLTELSSRLLAEREVVPRARLIAAKVAELIPGAAVVVYVVEDPAAPEWTAKAILGDVRLPRRKVAWDDGPLRSLTTNRQPHIYDSSAIAREEYAHIDLHRSFLSLAYIPLIAQESLVGALEVVSFDNTLEPDDLSTVMEVADCGAIAIAAALSYESERNASLRSISRIAQLYDIEKVLNSILEMDELLPIVASKFAEILGVQALNVWMVDGNEDLLLVSRSGFDPATPAGTIQKMGDGIPASVAENGESVLVDNIEDARLQQRNASIVGEEGQAFTVMASALLDRESLVGVVEAVNRVDGRTFDEDDLSLLGSLCETAAGALHNASLLQSERKVEILETLVQISTEITSTLNLDRVLQAVVNQTQAIIAFERAAIALEHRGALQIKAISGMSQINPADPQVHALQEMIEWASISTEETYVTQRDDQIDDTRAETRARFAEYFSQTGMRSFYALPLIDDQGRLGVLTFESSDPDFLTGAHFEIIKVLAGQATVALRNAALYREVPFINILEPLIQKKNRFMAMQKHRRATIGVAALAVVLFLLFCPMPMRVSGDATVAPLHATQIQSEVDGVVKAVYVHEGETVKQGDVLAELEDWNYRADLATAQARYSEAATAVNRALSRNDGTQAGTEQVREAYWKSELARAREKLDRTVLRAPWDGIVTTPRVENFVGRRLAHGDTFAEVIDSSALSMDVAIPEEDDTLLRVGQHASVKLESCPTRTFEGSVVVVAPQSAMASEKRVFYARVAVQNPDGTVRSGMQGLGKIAVGWHPAGYVLFRGATMWLWTKLWYWFGW